MFAWMLAGLRLLFVVLLFGFVGSIRLLFDLLLMLCVGNYLIVRLFP